MSNKTVVTMTPMTTGAVARCLRKSEQTVRRWERDGRLRAERTETGLRLFDPIAVAELAQELEQEQRAR
jgi:DNA-binding transcriptional MerR regulator